MTPMLRASALLLFSLFSACSGTETGNPPPIRGVCEDPLILRVTSNSGATLSGVSANGDATLCSSQGTSATCALREDVIDVPGVVSVTVSADGHVSQTFEIEIPAASNRCGYQPKHRDVILEEEP